MPIPDSFIQEVISRSDIESLVSSYVQLRRSGRNLTGLCPFHGEKTPSFTVYPENNSFYCFGCGAGGDVITFVRRIEHLDYVDAVKFLADRAGLRMPEMQKDDTASRLRTRILEANREAARFFHATLYSPAGAEALAYYHSRGYTDSTIKRFGLGFAPADGWSLRDALRKKGYHDDELLMAFLCKRAQKGHLYDVFRNRVIVPIIDIRGNVIGFGGRVLDDSKPKYINTSDTPVYNKSENLFALNFAKAALGKEKDGVGRLILCEGYMDVIALHQAGFGNAVAALGTSFTAEHARLIARYADEVILTFDADAAGQKGTRRAIDLLRETGVRIRVVRVPDGKDPDEFIKKNGAERFRMLIERSANDVEYRLMELAQRYALNTADGRIQYLSEAATLLAQLNGSVERDVYAGKLANDLNVSKDAILKQIQDVARRRDRQQQKRQLSNEVRRAESLTKKANPQAADYPRAARAEEALLGLLMRNPDYIPQAADALPPETMLTDFNRGLYQQLIARHQSGLLLELPFLAAAYDDDAMAYITQMMHAAAERSNTPEEVRTCIDVIKQERKNLLLRNPDTLSDGDIQTLLDSLRNSKK